MWPFALFAIVSVAVTLALLLRPLLSGKPLSSDAAEDAANVTVHRERLREIDDDLEAGRITPQEESAARDEVRRELLGDLDGRARPAGTASSPAWRSALVIALAVPALSLGIHFHLGGWHALTAGPGEGSRGGDPAAHLEALAAKLRAQPDDAEGWARLGRAYVALERYREGIEAFAAAYRISGDHPDLLADYAEAEALYVGYRFQGPPARRLEHALRIDPRHRKSLWLAGLAALQSARPELAVERWRTLLALPETGPEQARVIEALIARTLDEPGAAAGSEGGGPTLVVRVELDERFRGELDGSESLFVYAQAVGGPSLPLAVRRESAGALPLTVRLDDGASMLAGRTLSSADRVSVGARVSRAGTANAQSGDIQGMSEAIDVRAGEIEVVVVLDERLP